MRLSFLSLFVLLLVAAPHVRAQQQRAESALYQVPTDVVSGGGGEAAKSTNYVLDDTIGEANVGPSRSATYDLNAGYRQTVGDAYLALNCGAVASVGTITVAGQQTGSVTCTTITDAEAGYSLSWQVTTGSGGTNTGYLISPSEQVIAPYSPAVIGTPETWSVLSNTSEWGGRLSSTSTDTDNKWGVDSSSEKWLNVGTGSYTIVSRSTRTAVAGSDQVVQFRVEVGAYKTQPAGTYEATVVLTATSL